MKTYSSLEEKFEYDKQQATDLAEAMTELLEVERRAQYLRDIVKRHSKLKKFLWGTETGQLIALHDIPDSHLQNIINYLPKHDREISPQILAEARSRGFEFVGNNGLAPLKQIAANTEFSDDNEVIDILDW